MKEDNNPENEIQKEPGLGSLLKEEREKKGLTVRQVAGITRLREHFIEALEEEEWEKLPARVFIKGFIRSYANAIGYSSKDALSLFEKTHPPGEEEAPKPLVEKEKKKSRIGFYALLIVILIVILYLNRGRLLNLIGEKEIVKIKTEEKVQGNGNAIPENISKTVAPKESKKPIAETLTKKPELATPKAVPKETKEVETGAKTDTKPENLQEPAAAPKTEIEPKPLENAALPANNLILTAIVKMKTYVRIIVDDNPPKEYIFQPGSRPQWSAQKGFDVTVGNAAGIEFEFNGKTFNNLGELGQVKRLRFPKDFKTGWEG